jgi:ribosomal silencing factor RsfS
VKAIAESIEKEIGSRGGKLLGIEGLDYSHWVLLDYGDVIVDAKLLDIDEDKIDLGGQDKRAVHS